jgi:hypothetical protein
MHVHEPATWCQQRKTGLDARFTVRTRRRYHGSSLPIIAPCLECCSGRSSLIISEDHVEAPNHDPDQPSRFRRTVAFRSSRPSDYPTCLSIVPPNRVWSHCIPGCSKVDRRIHGRACRTLRWYMAKSMKIHTGTAARQSLSLAH